MAKMTKGVNKSEVAIYDERDFERFSELAEALKTTT